MDLHRPVESTYHADLTLGLLDVFSPRPVKDEEQEQERTRNGSKRNLKELQGHKDSVLEQVCLCLCQISFLTY